MNNEPKLERTAKEIDELLNNARHSADEGVTRFSGQSYEEGILAAIDWLVGDTDEHPYPDE